MRTIRRLLRHSSSSIRATHRAAVLEQRAGAGNRRKPVYNTGPWLNGKWMSRCMALRAALDRFSQGGVIPIAARPLSGGKSSFMRQLFRWREEVWEIRSLEEPGIRVLGRFADTDLFIALTWHKRADLLGPKSRQWRDAIIGCKTNWVNLFPAYPPKSGGSNAYPTDYISANTILV
jgi:hypothetical protein